MQRMTRQRLAVMEMLARCPDFLSAQQLHDELRQHGERIGLATVYRTLQTMLEAGDVEVVRSEDGEALYHRCSQDSHHHHLVCRNCQSSVDISAAEVEGWIDRAAAAHGFIEVEHTIDVFGVCAECVAKRESKV